MHTTLGFEKRYTRSYLFFCLSQVEAASCSLDALLAPGWVKSHACFQRKSWRRHVTLARLDVVQQEKALNLEYPALVVAQPNSATPYSSATSAQTQTLK